MLLHQSWLFQWLPLALSKTDLPSCPPVPADGSPALRTTPAPRRPGAPRVAAESSGWGPNGGAKIPAPCTYLLRQEPHRPWPNLGLKAGQPHCLLPTLLGSGCRAGRPSRDQSLIALIHLFGNEGGERPQILGIVKVAWLFNSSPSTWELKTEADPSPPDPPSSAWRTLLWSHPKLIHSLIRV